MEPFTKTAENETAQLQRAIFSQYIMMKKLFMELEEEKQASATAASATLSTIRKLQKEKELERMEAWQYKRIAEERMSHTNKALDIVKDVMQHKELEVYYLRNQSQVYKQKLLNIGIDDCDISYETMTKNLPLFETKSVENLCHNIKRNFSLPTLQLNKHFAEMDMDENDAAIQLAKSRLGIYMANSSQSELEQVYSDDDDDNNLKVLEAEESFSTGIAEKHEKAKSPMEESSQFSPFSVVNHQTDICSQRATQAGEDAKDILLEGIAGHCTDDADTTTKNREPGNVLSKFSATRKVGSMNNVDRHVSVSMGNSTPRDGIERTKSTLKRVQSEKRIELNEHRKSKEQIIMLKEVYEQLDMIEAHMRSTSSKETPRSLDFVMEAALASPFDSSSGGA